MKGNQTGLSMFIRAACVVLLVCEAVHCGRMQRNEAPSPDFNWNNIADNIIHLIRSDVIHQGKTEVTLPDVDEDKTIDIGFAKVSYKLRASEGSAGNVSVFRRKGDVILSKDSADTLQGVVPLTLDRMHVRYGSYNLKVLWFDVHGVWEGSMQDVLFHVTVFGKEVGQGCEASITDVKVADVGKLDVNITGLGSLNQITSIIVRVFMETRRIGILSIIEGVLLEHLSKVSQEYECDQLHSLFLLGGTR